MDTQTKKCPKCGMDIPAVAVKCPFCQSEIAVKKKPSRLVWGFFISSMLFVFITVYNFEPSDGTATYVSNADPVEWAGTYAVVNVKKSLKAPSTAEFPTITNSDITELGNGLYSVTSYVDSQNSFGAMIRSNWTVTLSHNGGDAEFAGNWIVEKIVIDDEVVHGR